MEPDKISENHTPGEQIFENFRAPILIVSTVAGRGNVSVAEAILELLPKGIEVYHLAIEDLLPANAVREDLLRYKFISDKLPFMLNLIYKLPIFYFRKFFREKMLRTDNMRIIRDKIAVLKIKTVIGISHRPTFWMSAVKKREDMDFELWGVLTEFGETLGWKYIFWDMVNGYIAPFDKNAFHYRFPATLKFVRAEPFCRRKFDELANLEGDLNKVLFMAGFWGQIFFKKAAKILSQILDEFSEIRIIVICGTNQKLHHRLRQFFKDRDRIKIYGKVDNVWEIVKDCASVITKPGFSTIVEAFHSRREIFLLKGMPVAEDNNAKYAIVHFGAHWFSEEAFRKWYFNKQGSWNGIKKEIVKCPLCGGPDYALVEENYDRITEIIGVFKLVKCNACGLLYVNPRPPKEELYKNFYPDNYPAYLRTAGIAKKYKLNTTFLLIKLYYALRNTCLFKKLWRLILNPIRTRGEIDLRIVHLDSGSKVLDIGCGTGIFLDHLRWLTGCEVNGIELNEAARNSANELLGQNAVPVALLEKNNFADASFDLVTMWLVFEHLTQPMEGLKEASRLVKDDGWFVMAVPHIGSWGRKVFKDKWCGLDLPRHLQFLTFDTAKLFLEKNNFKIRKIKYGGSHPLASLQIAVTGRRCAFSKEKKGFSIEENIFLRCLAWPLSFLATLLHGSDIIVIYSQKVKG